MPDVVVIAGVRCCACRQPLPDDEDFDTQFHGLFNKPHIAVGNDEARRNLRMQSPYRGYVNKERRRSYMRDLMRRKRHAAAARKARRQRELDAIPKIAAEDWPH